MHDRYETVYKPLIDKGTPEKAANAAMAGTKQGASTFRTVMGSLKPAQRDAVAAHVLEEMGRAPSNAQDATGQAFSADTFFRKWQDMHEDAKKALFPSPQTRSDLDTVIEAMANVKSTAKGGLNPSGTARAVTHAGFAGAGMTGILLPLLSGNVHAAAVTAGALGGEVAINHAAARAMTSPEFIRWLADGTKVNPQSPAEARRYLARLAVIANNTRDPETKQAIEGVQAGLGSPADAEGQ